MITVKCTCGQQYQIESEAVADQFGCPQCGATAAEVLAPAQPQFQIHCSTHLDQPATHNCLHCAKPLCMECVSANGYYCSAACKAAVAAAVPDAVSADLKEITLVGDQIEKQMEAAGKVGRKIGMVLLIAVGLVGLWFVGRWILAPKGKIVATLPVGSAVAQFRFVPAGAGAVLVQANAELALIKIPSMEKSWSVQLSEWQEPVVSLQTVQDDVIILQSYRRVVALAKATGQFRWEYAVPGQARGETIVHAGGIWLGTVNLALATGEPTGLMTNANYSGCAIAGGRLALLTIAPQERDQMAEEVTAGSIHNIDVKSILAEAQGKKRRPRAARQPHHLRFYSMADGQLLGEKTIQVPYDAKLQAVGNDIAVVTDTEMQLYRDQAEPVATLALPAAPEQFVTRNGLLVVATEAGAVAFEQQTGAPRWHRPDLRAQTVAIGPDGAVYVTVALKKDEVRSGAAANYRVAGRKVGVSAPAATYRALVRLDPQTGATVWGVRNIGEQVLFEEGRLFVVDRLHDMNLLADQIMVGSHSVRELAPRTGEDIWEFQKPGDLYHCAVTDGRVVAVTATDPPTGRGNPVCPFELVVIAGK